MEDERRVQTSLTICDFVSGFGYDCALRPLKAAPELRASEVLSENGLTRGFDQFVERISGTKKRYVLEKTAATHSVSNAFCVAAVGIRRICMACVPTVNGS